MPRGSATRERTCVVTREAMPADRLLRFVAGPDGDAVPDLRERLPGRGAWVSAERATLEKAIKSRRLQKALDLAAPVDPDLPDRVDALLLDLATGALALARKAGTVVTGFGKVEEAIRRGRAVALIHAVEAADDGREKLAAALRRAGCGDATVIRCFDCEHLDLAFGRTNVIHAALLAGPASDNVLQRVGVLARYRGGQTTLAGGGNPNETGRVADASPGY